MEKAINKTISVYPEQLRRIGKVVDLNRHGNLSQFIQDAAEEKLEKLGYPKPEPEQKAS